MDYQPTMSEDGLISEAPTIRDFHGRYQSVADNWPERISVAVDFGAHAGTLIRKLALDGLTSSGVAIDGYSGLSGDSRITAINRDVTPRELGKIIREQPGNTTVIALSVLHHLPEWEKYLGAISRNAKTAFVETANPDEVLPEAVAHGDSGKIIRAVEKLGGVPVGESAGWDSRFMRTTWRIDF